MLKRKPYILLLATAVLSLVLGFFTSNADKIVFNVHDTYYVITYSNLCWLFAEISGSFFLIYWLLEKGKGMMIPLLSLIHIFGTLLSFLGVIFPYHFIFQPSKFPLFDDLQRTNTCIALFALLFLILQILFIINIFVSIIKKLSNSASK